MRYGAFGEGYVPMLVQIPAYDYHAHPALGSTSLKRALITPSHYWAFANENPERIEQEETPALCFGRLSHCIVLEGDEVFKRDFYVLPDGINKRTNAGKAEYAAHIAAAGKRTVVTVEMVEQARMMRKVLEKHFVWNYLEHGVSEGSVFWSEDGIECKARLDWVKNSHAGNIVIDYKTSADASPEAFSRSVDKFGYHIQAAHYSKGFEAAYGEQPKAFIFVAQEKEPPYAVGAYMIEPQDIVTGDMYRQKALNAIREGRKTGIWNGYTKKIETITLPTWAQYKAAEELNNQ